MCVCLGRGRRGPAFYIENTTRAPLSKSHALDPDQRSAQAFVSFIEGLLQDTTVKVDSEEKIAEFLHNSGPKETRRVMIGRFAQDSAHIKAFESLGQALQDDCKFVLHVG